MLDLKVKQQLSVITTNFDLVKAELTESIKKYKGMVVTEETLKSCKADQIMLGKMEKKIDDYRKTTKQEAEEPIKAFEDNCNVLKALVSDAKVPLKAGIQVFDDKARAIKKQIAIEHINTTILDLVLNEKYSSQLTVYDVYGNASMSIKKMKDDIEKRGFLLQQEQNQEAENLQIIKDTIENYNKNIDAKMYIEDFEALIESETISTILQSINTRAERTKANELKAIADNKAKAEKEVLERIARAERETLLKAKQEREKEEFRLREIELKEVAQKQKEANSIIEKAANEKTFKRQIETKSEIANYAKEITPPIKEKTIKVKMYFIEMRVEGDIEEIQALSKYLKDNNYNYKASDKGRI